MVAIIYKGSRILSIGFSSKKTEPMYKDAVERHHICGMYEDCPGWHSYGRHAEMHAIKRCPEGQLKGATIFIARYRHDGTAGASKPCSVCSKIIENTEIKHVAFYGKDSLLVQERVHSRR